jgi:hypothetical protein
MGREPRVLLILAGTGAWAAGACCTGFGLWFAPGWANGWPFGLHRNVVWPLGMSVVAFAAVLALGVGVGAAVCEEGEDASV